MKRLFDIFAAIVGLMALSPIMAVAALFIYIDSGRPIFYRQARVGEFGQQFFILKFRSMIPDADKKGGFSTSKGDARITKVGQTLRRTSIDELPQLLNVLCGDMSIVGPRPDVPAQRSLYTDAEWKLRTSVKPGITGLAQAAFRSDCTEAERKELDLKYIQERSFVFDIKIIFMTIRQIFGRGGY